jgi:drug/metabolite transporter (DMT)-like permease
MFSSVLLNDSLRHFAMNYFLLHLLFLLYATNTVLGRLASHFSWMSWQKYAFVAGVLCILGIYAIGWQLMLKRFSLGVAYANRSAVVLWGILLAWLCCGETLSIPLFLGAALVIGGIIIVSTGGEDA